MSGTPRSARVKKKSALSRLAERSGNTPRGSLGSDPEMTPPSPRVNRHDDLIDTLYRQRLSAEAQSTASDNYKRGNHYDRTDSDEGIEMNTAPDEIVSEQLRGSLTKHQSLAIGSKKLLQSDDEVSDDDNEDDDLQSSYSKGEKRYRDQNSDSDDLKGRSHKEPLRSSPQYADHTNERPRSRLGYDADVNLSGRYQQQHRNSSDDDDYKPDSKSEQSLDLGKRLSMKHTGDNLTMLYHDALMRHESDSQRNDLDSDSERDDGLADLKHHSPSPPKYSDRSPEHHTYSHKISSASLMSTISSRTFMLDGDKPDPFAEQSQDSLQSTSVLPLISTKEARNRCVFSIQYYLIK